MIYHTCATPGMAGFDVHFQEEKGEIEARQLIAIFGRYNMKTEDLEKIDFNPFHPDFHDNYVSGKGKTKEEALEALKKDSENLYESLWI